MSLSERLNRAAAERAGVAVALPNPGLAEDPVVLDLTDDRPLAAVIDITGALGSTSAAATPALPAPAPAPAPLVEDPHADARRRATPLAADAARLAALRARGRAAAQAAAPHEDATAPAADATPAPRVLPLVSDATLPAPAPLVPRWAAPSLPAVPPPGLRERVLRRVRSRDEVRRICCPGCGHTARVDIVDRVTGRRHLSCEYCFRMWQEVGEPTWEPHPSALLLKD